MPRRPEPVDRRPGGNRLTPTKFERIFSYCVILVVVLLGILVFAGAFGISSRFRGILGAILVGYGSIRFLLMRAKFDKRRESGER